MVRDLQGIKAVKGTVDPRSGYNAIAGAVQVKTMGELTGGRLRVMAGDYATLEAQAIATFRHGGFSRA